MAAATTRVPPQHLKSKLGLGAEVVSVPAEPEAGEELAPDGRARNGRPDFIRQRTADHAEDDEHHDDAGECRDRATEGQQRVAALCAEHVPLRNYQQAEHDRRADTNDERMAHAAGRVVAINERRP